MHAEHIQDWLKHKRKILYLFCVLDAEVKKNELLLFIGIMSSQNNSEARQSIRDTWLNLTEKKDIKYFFVLGKEICNIPPEDRMYKEACIEWTVGE